MLGAAEADAFGAKRHGVSRLVRLVGVGPDLQGPVLVRPLHDLGERLVDRGVLGIERLLDQDLQDLGGLGADLALEHLAGRAVDGDPVAFFESAALDRHGKRYEREAEGLLAVCVQHEMDHLEGKLFVDYLSELKRTRIRRKLEKDHRQRAADSAPGRAL